MSEHRPNPLRAVPSEPGPRPSGRKGVTSPASAYAGYRDAVSGLMHADEPFVEVEEAIDGTDLDEDVRAALWLLAFSMRDPRGRRREARMRVHSVS